MTTHNGIIRAFDEKPAVMTPQTFAPLLASIETQNLIIVCGAGLSRTEPSNVPAAAELSRQCARMFTMATGRAVPDEIESDLARLAAFFYTDPNFWRLFLDRLIDWGPFTRGPNKGHFAIADLLACQALRFAVSANFDELIEVAAQELGEPILKAALDGAAMLRVFPHKPLLKVHGCMRIDRYTTVWCEAQCGEAAIAQRLQSSRDWLSINLQDSHILVVGFWSDWPYLNDALSAALQRTPPTSITLVDIGDEHRLREKAPQLWAVAERLGAQFKRVEVSGADFLDALRKQLSLVFFDQVLVASTPTYLALGGTTQNPAIVRPTELTTDELYNLRRDICGVAPEEIVRERTPSVKTNGVGAAHLLVQEKGAHFSGNRYVRGDGARIRIVNGATDSFHRVKARFSKGQPASNIREISICVGAADDGGVPANIVRNRESNDITKAIASSEWLSFNEARAKGLC